MSNANICLLLYHLKWGRRSLILEIKQSHQSVLCIWSIFERSFKYLVPSLCPPELFDVGEEHHSMTWAVIMFELVGGVEGDGRVLLFASEIKRKCNTCWVHIP